MRECRGRSAFHPLEARRSRGWSAMAILWKIGDDRDLIGESDCPNPPGWNGWKAQAFSCHVRADTDPDTDVLADRLGFPRPFRRNHRSRRSKRCPSDNHQRASSEGGAAQIDALQQGDQRVQETESRGEDRRGGLARVLIAVPRSVAMARGHSRKYLVFFYEAMPECGSDVQHDETADQPGRSVVQPFAGIGEAFVERHDTRPLE
jgi:hypothetical protein